MNAGITVPGTANPYLAGQPNGTTASGTDVAPDESPVLVIRTLSPGEHLSFIVSGSTNNDPGPSGLSPDGGGSFSRGSEHGLAGYTTNVNALLGVFLDDSTPTDPAPDPFSASQSDAVFTPGLRQPFFIGDGLTGTGDGQRQEFVVPAGATRLFLASADGCCWYNNYGSFDVQVFSNCVLPPGVFRARQWSSADGGNDHYYEVVYVSNGITWAEAKTSAELRGGHLATIASSAENDFVFSLVSGDDRLWYRNSINAGIGPWLGGFQPDGSPEPDGGWNWVTGEDFFYTNWAPGEPNNSGGTENKLHFYSSPGGALEDNHWNDISPDVLINGYVVEYDFGDPAEGGLVAWWPGDGNAHDIWGGNNGFLQNGATFADGEVNQAFILNGVNQFVLVPPTTGTDAASDNSAFTVDAWIYPTSDDMNPVVEWSDNGNYGVHLWEGYGCLDGCGVRGALSGALYANVIDTSGGQHYMSTAGGLVPINAWSHVALTYQHQTGDAIIYLNGAPVATSNFGSFTPRTNLQLNFGARPFTDGGCSGNGCFFTGEIDEVELFDRALSRDEILSIFNAGSGGKCKPQCVPPPSDLVAWYPAEDNAADIANGNDGAFQNGATTSNGFIGQAFDLNGENQFVQVPSNSATDFTSSFTIEAWLYLRSYSSELAPIASTWNDIGTSNRSYFLAITAGGQLRLSVSQSGGAYYDVYSNETVPLNKWTHVAGVFDASQQILRIYIDGALQGQGSAPPSVHASGEPLLIGAGDLGSNVRDFTNGLIDELKLYNTPLSSDQIMVIFGARGAGSCNTVVEQTDLFDAFVDKNETFVQTSTDDPAPENGTPFQLVVGVDATGPNNITSASFTPPGGSATALTQQNASSFDFFSANFSNQTNFDAAFPDGDYAFDIRTAHAPFELTPIIPINYDLYPVTPKILNTDWSSSALHVEDPTQDYVLQWNAFNNCAICGGIADRPGNVSIAGATSASTIDLLIEDASHNIVTEIFSLLSPYSTIPTEYRLPANTLSPGQTYHAQLQFANLQDSNNNGAQLSGQYATITKFDIITPALAPPPVCFNGHTYMLTSVAESWTEAEAEAVSKGGHLVSINSSAEQAFLADAFLVDAFLFRPLWIGLTDRAKEGKFVWTNGDKFKYSNWNSSTHEPNDCCNRKIKHEEDYVTMNWHYARNLTDPIGSWNDVPNDGTSLDGNAHGPYFGIIEIPNCSPPPAP